MRKYTVPVSMALEYTLADHLGSASITTDKDGAKVSEIRYKPCSLRYRYGVQREGEIRYAWKDPSLTTTPAYALTKYTYAGQFSYLNKTAALRRLLAA